MNSRWENIVKGKGKVLAVFAVFLVMTGCSSKTIRIGSQDWYNQRILEVEEAYQNKEISKAEYLQLKNETDKIRSEYLSQYDIHSYSHYGYRSKPKGGSIGIGVGF